MQEETSGIMSDLLRQLNHFWDIENIDCNNMLQWVTSAVEKVNISFGASNNKYFLDKGFCTYNSAQYCVFLYYLSNIIGKAGETELADKVYYLNKIMNSVDLYWEIALPPHFVVEHPLGLVMGRAQYGDYLAAYQGVTVGGNRIGNQIQYPKLGNYVVLYANATILGGCSVGDYVVFSANGFVKDEIIPDYSIVFGSSPNLTIKEYDREKIKQYFLPLWRELK